METVTTRHRARASGPRSPAAAESRWLGVGLLALAAALAVNSLLGPLVAGVIRYPFSQTMLNQTLGLEAVSLILVAPLCALAGALALRGSAVAPVLAIGPAAYAAYMFTQYVIGPEYTAYPPAMALHLGIFILSSGLLLAGWAKTRTPDLPAMAQRSRMRWAAVLLALAAFVVSRYVPAFVGMITGEPLAAEPLADVTMHWTIFFLDLGMVVPAAVATAVALIRGAEWAEKGLYSVIGWFALVPPSVAAMGVAMVINDDPHASPAQTAVFVVAAAIFTAVAVRLYRPVLPVGAQTAAARRSGLSAAVASPQSRAD